MMFNFYDSEKNPFMVLMKQMASQEEGGGEGAAPGSSLGEGGLAGEGMRLVRETCDLQMRLAQSMLGMQVEMAQALVGVVGEGRMPQRNQSGFKLGGIDVPPELLAMAMQLEMSPENLAKLQKALDVAFSVVPEKPSDER